MKIISISGLDGSGKSTQAQMLQAYLEQQGKKVQYFHAIQFSFPQKLKEFKNKHCLIRRFTKACNKGCPKQEKSEAAAKSSIELCSSAVGVTKANCFQIQLRKIALIIDIIRFKFFKKNLTKQGYDYLITDRYFYDSIVNLSYLEKKNTPSCIKKYIPAADAAFYIKLQPEAIMTRDRVPDQGLEYLKSKKRLYDMFSILWNFKAIDGSKKKEEIFNDIKSQIQMTNIE